jgi:pimeloyl-ACP methyl ester carboxylesterase
VVEDFLAVVEATPQLVVVGHSLGGAIALSLALREIVPLGGLVLVSTAARFRIDPVFLQRFLDGEHGLAFSPEASPQLVEISRRRWEENARSSVLTAFAAAAAFDARSRLAEVRAPTMVICGTEDRFTPPELSEELARGIAGAKLALIPRAGHLPMLERPQEFAALLQAFLEERQDRR